MMTIDNVEYRTKAEAAQACREFAATDTRFTFHNYAHCKAVRRNTTPAEQDADRASLRCVRLTVTVYEWNKLYTDGIVLKAHPELKGMWRQRQGAEPQAG